MGTGIAQVAATAGHDVILYDNNPDALGRARQKLAAILKRLVEKGKMDDPTADGILNRIQFEDSIFAYKDTGLVKISGQSQAASRLPQNYLCPSLFYERLFCLAPDGSIKFRGIKMK